MVSRSRWEGMKKEYGSPGRARTADKVINSHLLYQLSYRGTVERASYGFGYSGVKSI